MPAQTQDIKKYLETCDNMYEAANLIAMRARQINEDLFQKKRDREIMEELDGGFDDDLLHADEPEEEVDDNVEIEENPVVVATREFVSNKIGFGYNK